MREDFSKLVHERGRVHKGPSAKTAKRIDVRTLDTFVEGKDNEVNHISSNKGRVYGWDCNDQAEYTSPWIRFLKKSVGRKWDDVYSELKKAVDFRTEIGHLISDWVRWNITFDCFVSGKKVVEHSSLGGIEVFGFYVHPVTGILCDNPYPSFRSMPPSRERMSRNIKEIWVDKHCQYTLVSTDYPFYSWRNPKTSKWHKISWKYMEKDTLRFDMELGKMRVFKAGERIRWSYRLANSKEVERVKELLQAEQKYIMKTGERLKSLPPE